MFVVPPPSSLLCCICFDVLENPQTLVTCGHSFCAECVLEVIPANDDNDAPTKLNCSVCRKICLLSSIHPSATALRGILHSLNVLCENTAQQLVVSSMPDDVTTSTTLATMRAAEPLNDTAGLVTNTTNNANNASRKCQWIGSLDEWARHIGKRNVIFPKSSVIGESADFTKLDLVQQLA